MGVSAGATPVNEDVSLLEAGLTFDIGETENLDLDRRNRPVKYALDANSQQLQILTASEEEVSVFENSSRIVDFQGAKGDVTKIGGNTVQSLSIQNPEIAESGIYARSERGYRVPEFEVNWDATTPGELLQSPAVKEISSNDGLFELRLPTTNIDIRTKVVHDDRVDRDDILEWRKGKKTEFSTETRAVDPYLTVAYHRGIDVSSE
ncbi:hypothetical protein NGM10_06955 [Halorussus salilacus]|uniref:hypothetical protein n=1 Tax=Halorussus salilacus TaxID=2953750 RepID=UPI00209E6FAA|nr:hypothetical protein [Halorussus salilacus]USZ69467.1 hypothetical protein NGM10_06955 [Halorussus salilacus]